MLEPGLKNEISSLEAWSASPMGHVKTWPEQIQALANMMLFSFDAQWICYGDELNTFFNQAFKELFSSDNEQGQPSANIWKKRWPEISGAIQEAKEQKKSIHINNHQLLLAVKGKQIEKYISFAFNPIVSSDKQVIGVFCTTSDVTPKTTLKSPTEVFQKGDLEQGLNPGKSLYFEAANRLHELLMQAPAYIALLRGPDHIFELSNDRYMQMIGQDRAIIGKPVSEALPEVIEQGFINILDQVYQTGKPFIGNEVPVKLDRTGTGEFELLYLNFIYQPFKGPDGKTEGVFAHGVDATEQVLSRQKISESEEKYRGIFETMDQGFCIVEMIFDDEKNPVDYIFIEYNPPFEKQTGLENAIGKRVRQLVPNLEKRWFELYGKVALTGESKRFIESSIAMNRWFEVFAFRLGDEDSKKVAILFTDITERKISEERLRYHATITKNIADAVISTNLGHKIKSWNSAAEKLYGWKAEEVLGRNIGEVIPTTFGLNKSEDWENMLSTKGMWKGEIVQNRKDGTLVPVLASVSYVKNENDEPIAIVSVNRDITDQKNNEKALQDSEQRFKLYAEVMPQMAFIADPEGNIIYFNQRWYEYIGLEKGSEGWGWKNQNIHHPDDLERTVNRWNESLKTGKPYEIEYRLMRHDGQYRWHLGRAEAVQDSEGSIEMWLGTNTDIHSQKEAVEALRRSEEYYKTMTDNTPVITWISHAGGGCSYLNRQWSDFTGQKQEEALEYGWLKPVHPDDRERITDMLLSTNQNQTPFNLEFRLRRKDGQYKWHLYSGLPKFDDNGEFEGFVGAIIDIHERKITEEKLQESEEFSRTLLESSPDCVKALDIEGRLLSINPQGLKMLEIDDFSVFKNSLWLEFWRGKYYDFAKEAVESAKNGKIGHFSGFKPTMKGAPMWWDVLVAPVYGASGKVEHLISVSRDISMLKALEQQKDDFLGIASHELKTPVTSIKAYTQVLQNRFQEANDTQAATMLGKMDSQLNKLTSLISDLLDVTKIEQGQIMFKKEKFMFNELVQEISEEIQRTSKKHKINIQLDDPREVIADKDRLGQVITNFLTNAIKYSPKSNKVDIKTQNMENEILFSVKDFGVGLSKEDQARVFERFYRVEGTGYETYPGLGLGLFISAEIIHRHRGDIWVESEKGEGSVFYFKLPIKINRELKS